MTKYECAICKKSTTSPHRHALEPSNTTWEEPLAFTIDLQGFYDNAPAIARQMGLARWELRTYFPGRNFEIQPQRMMVRNDGGNCVVLGEAYVACYVVFEV